jgi:hypothetical protein
MQLRNLLLEAINLGIFFLAGRFEVSNILWCRAALPKRPLGF